MTAGATRLARLTSRVSLPVLVLLLTACATQPAAPVQPDVQSISKDMLLETSPVAVRAAKSGFEEKDILELSPELTGFLDESIRKSMSESARVRELVSALTASDRFELIYDDQTRTAAEAFRDGQGNCLSFTNMFVAMARYVGLQASYQEVEIPPDWSSAGHALLISQHINAFVDLTQYTDRVVDFNTEVVTFLVHDLEPSYKREVVSDARARAHYYNNVGVEKLLLEGDSDAAFLNVRQSILEDETFSPAWISLGIVYRREEQLAYAEAAYLKALEFDPGNLVAMSNLASLYELQGRAELAESYRVSVQSHRMKNPYYRYELAKEAFLVGDYPTSIDHLKFSIQKRPYESGFYSLQAMSYLMNGDRDKALQNMQKAEELAAGESERRLYRRKIDMLTGGSGG